MGKFQVFAPEDDYSSLGFPVEKSTHNTAEAAIEAAKKVAKEIKKLATTVIVVEDGTPNVWSIQYHPDRPVATGAVDELGIPQFEFQTEYRVVFDGTVNTVDKSSKSDEPRSAGFKGDQSVFDIKADGEEVDRDDLLA